MDVEAFPLTLAVIVVFSPTRACILFLQRHLEDWKVTGIPLFPNRPFRRRHFSYLSNLLLEWFISTLFLVSWDDFDSMWLSCSVQSKLTRQTAASIIGRTWEAEPLYEPSRFCAVSPHSSIRYIYTDTSDHTERCSIWHFIWILYSSNDVCSYIFSALYHTLIYFWN